MKKTLCAVSMVLAVLAVLMGRGLGLCAEKKVTHAFDKNFPPFSFVRNQKPMGFEVEILRAALKNRGIKLVAKPMGDWEMAQAELSGGVVQILSGMARTELREKLFLFPDMPTLSMGAKFFVPKQNRVQNLKELRGKTVSVKKGTIHHSTAQAFGGLKVKPYETEEEALKALWLGEVEAFFGPDKTAYYLIDKNDFTGVSAVGAALNKTPVYFALYKGETELRNTVDQGLREITATGEYDRIYRKWFVVELSKSEVSGLVQAAKDAAANAYAPYGGPKAGAAVLAKSGRVYTGANIENANPNISVGAIEVAVIKAVSNGETEIRAVAGAYADGGVFAPTASERRLLYEFGRDILAVLETGPGKYDTEMISKLLPYALETR